MDATLALMAPGEHAIPASPFMMQDINFASVNTADANTWDLGLDDETLPSLQSQDELHTSFAELFGDEQPPTLAPQPTSSMRTVFGWRPSPSPSPSKPHRLPTNVDGMPASSASCLSIIADALAPRKPNYKPIANPGRIRIEQACEACRARKAKCDGGKPCDRCKDRGVNCAYKGSKLTRSRRNSHSEPVTAMFSNAVIPPRNSSRKARSAPAPLHLAHYNLNPPHSQNGQRGPSLHLPYREPPSAASSTGSFLSSYSTANSSARSTPMSADFPDFVCLHAEVPSGTGAMRHSRQNSRTHPYHPPPTSNRSSFCDPSAMSFVEGLPPTTDFNMWPEFQFTPPPLDQPGETSFATAGDDLSDLFNFCAAFPTNTLATTGQFSLGAPPMLDLASNSSESSNDSTGSSDSFASLESSLMLEFNQMLNTTSADEEGTSMNTSPANSPEAS